MFSPNSGSVNSAADDVSDGTVNSLAGVAGIFAAGGCAGAAACDGAGGFEATAGASALAGEGTRPLDPFSTVKTTWPTLTFSPCLTRTSFTVPLTFEGTSTTALSVSSSMTGCPSATTAPGAIMSRTKSP